MWTQMIYNEEIHDYEMPNNNRTAVESVQTSTLIHNFTFTEGLLLCSPSLAASVRVLILERIVAVQRGSVASVGQVSF